MVRYIEPHTFQFRVILELCPSSSPASYMRSVDLCMALLLQQSVELRSNFLTYNDHMYDVKFPRKIGLLVEGYGS